MHAVALESQNICKKNVRARSPSLHVCLSHLELLPQRRLLIIPPRPLVCLVFSVWALDATHGARRDRLLSIVAQTYLVCQVYLLQDLLAGEYVKPRNGCMDAWKHA